MHFDLLLRDIGNFYIVNGEKKFITSGTKAHYFTVAVRTGGAGTIAYKQGYPFSSFA